MKKALFLSTLIFFFFVLGVFFFQSTKKDSVYANGDYIKWVEFDLSSSALSDALSIDVSSRQSGSHVSFTEALSFASTKLYGNYKNYKSSVMSPLSNADEAFWQNLKDNKLYNYYIEAYTAAVGGLVGEYTKVCINENGEISESQEYGLRAFSPIAKGFYYNDYDDFGAARSYGYKRNHLGHDMMGSIGTPIIAVESGVVEACGWNQYGGWRIGIRSFDGLRYYYYAHLRKDHPFNDMYEGKIVNAGEVIGYLGMTGYSAKENVNNINIPHLHFGLELIFDPSQKDGYNQIWIDVFALTKFLYKNRSAVTYNSETKEYISNVYYIYPETPD